MLTRVVGVLGLLAVLFAAPASAAEQALAIEEEVTVDADSMTFDRRTNTAVATGHVVIRRSDMELRADEVRLNRATNEAEATGQVSLSNAEGVILADRMQLSLDEETGALLQGRIYSRQLGFSLTGERIEKGVGHKYHLENATFTTCRCDDGRPSWSVAGDMLDVTLDGYGILRGGTFKVLDVPIFYAPRAAFPVARERQSGLLFPRVGVSNQRGFQIVQPAYWAIDKSQDATVGIDIETSARLGLVGEYRYAASRAFRGSLHLAYFNEAIRGATTGLSKSRTINPQVPENRWSLITEHTQAIGSAEAYADVQLVGDDFVLREINTLTVGHDEDVALRTRPFTESRVGALQRWERLALQAQAVVYEDLIRRHSLALQHAPEVRLWGRKQVGFGLSGELTASATNFQRGIGIAGLRSNVEPTATMNLPLGRSLAGSLHATFVETAYQLTEDRMTDGFRGDDPAGETIDLPSQRSRETVRLGADIGSGLSRTFSVASFGLDKVRHTIEPRVEYLYVPLVDQDRLMVFDGTDRIAGRNLVTYGVVSRLLARVAGASSESVREFGRLSLAQSYDVRREIPSSVRSGAYSHFSDIDIALRVDPSNRTSLRLVSTLDATSADVSGATIGAVLREPNDFPGSEGLLRPLKRTRLGLSYRFITENPLKIEDCGSGQLDCGIQQVDSNIMIRLSDRIGFLYANRYNLRESRFLENRFGLNLRSACDCWALDLGVIDKSNPREIEFRAQLTLVGLGSDGDLDSRPRE